MFKYKCQCVTDTKKRYLYGSERVSVFYFFENEIDAVKKLAEENPEVNHFTVSAENGSGLSEYIRGPFDPIRVTSFLGVRYHGWNFELMGKPDW